MDASSLIYFNSAGYPINTQYNSDVNYQYASIYFDKNSTETFKSLGIFAFEEIQPTNNTFQAYLDQYQLFNTEGFYSWPPYTSSPVQITNILTTNISSAYNTKWIYGTNIELFFNAGDWIYFTGLTGFFNTDFDQLISGNLQVFQILLVEPGRILVKTTTNNSIAFPTFVPSTTITIVPINVIEYDTFDPSFPAAYAAKMYAGKQLSFISSSSALNNDVFTVKGTTIQKDKDVYTFSPITPYNPAPPAAPDILNITVQFYTDRLLVSSGNTTFGPGSNPSGIQLPYIPPTLAIGDIIIAGQKTVALVGGNTVNFTITAIDNANNIVTVSPAPVLQNVDCYMFIETPNELSVQQPLVLDNNTTYSMTATFQSFVSVYGAQLAARGVIATFDPVLFDLVFTSEYAETGYFTASVELLPSTSTFVIPGIPQLITGFTYTIGSFSAGDDFSLSGTLVSGIVNTTGYTFIYNGTPPTWTHGSILYAVSGPVPVVHSTLGVFPHWITTTLPAKEHILADASTYSNSIVFSTIDSDGLNVTINGHQYTQDFDVDIPTTINAWLTEYQAALSLKGIETSIATTNVANDTLFITVDYPNVPIQVSLQMGTFSVYYVAYADYVISSIKNTLLITINGNNYSVPFVTSDLITVTNWVNAYKALLLTLGIIVLMSGSALEVGTTQPGVTLAISFNIGFTPLPGDGTVAITNLAPINSGSVIAGNEIKITPGTYNFLDYYSTGQRITIAGATKGPQNQPYNIIALTPSTISLSYQNAYWQQGLPTFSLNIVSNFWIRYPLQGLSALDNQATMRWSWKDTQSPEIFLYDFTGNQLQPIYTGFPAYDGPMPLCGPLGTNQVQLNVLPNGDLGAISNPSKQQTVFDQLLFPLPFEDSLVDPYVNSSPMQVFIGYNQPIESWVKARLYCELIVNLTFTLATSIPIPLTYDDLWTFTNDSLAISSLTFPVDFTVLGFIPGQLISLTSQDINPDGMTLGSLKNNGRILRILSVTQNTITFVDTNLIPETSVVTVPTPFPPYYDTLGNPITIQRYLSVSIKV